MNGDNGENEPIGEGIVSSDESSLEDDFLSSSTNSDGDSIFASSSSENDELGENEDEIEEYQRDILWPVFAILVHGRFRQRVQNYIEVARAKSGDEFRGCFRVTRHVFNVLLERLEQSGLIPTHTGGRPKKSAELSLLMTLSYLSQKSTESGVAEMFGVSQSTVHRIICRVLDFFMTLVPEVIVWPRGDKLQHISQGFSERGIVGCIGAIDGSHIPIIKPEVNGEEFYNRKQSYSILLQAVCDSDMKFTNCYCGDPGSFHDVRVLRRSSLYNEAERNRNELFPHGTFLLGDKGYVGVGRQWIVTPFRDNNNLTEAQTDFNRRISSTRVKVEQAFGIMKARFRKLKMMEMRDFDLMTRLVMSCCVLHNICISNGDIGEDLRRAEILAAHQGQNANNPGIGNANNGHANNVNADNANNDNADFAIPEEDSGPENEDEDEEPPLQGTRQMRLYAAMYPNGVL